MEDLVGDYAARASRVLVDASFWRVRNVLITGHTGFIPEGFAYAFQSLEDDSASLYYYISTVYEPASLPGVRWDDPALSVSWPLPDAAILSDRDLPKLAEFGARR